MAVSKRPSARIGGFSTQNRESNYTGSCFRSRWGSKNYAISAHPDTVTQPIIASGYKVNLNIEVCPFPVAWGKIHVPRRRVLWIFPPADGA